jgi:hypothetical protein
LKNSNERLIIQLKRRRCLFRDRRSRSGIKEPRAACSAQANPQNYEDESSSNATPEVFEPRPASGKDIEENNDQEEQEEESEGSSEGSNESLGGDENREEESEHAKENNGDADMQEEEEAEDGEEEE